jgi:competence protein ComEA
MLRFTRFQVTVLGVLLFLLGYGSYRLYAQSLVQRQLQQELLTEGFESLPAESGTAGGTPAGPIEKKTGAELLAVREAMKLNINTADVQALTQLPGIGPATAQNIVDHRNEHGPFQSIEQLTDVKRIGPSLMGKVREHITVGAPEPGQAEDAADMAAAAPAPGAPAAAPGAEDAAPDPLDAVEAELQAGAAASRAAKSSAPAGPIDINTASVAQLETLPRVGPSTARAIVEYRQKHGPFRSIEELANVPRIGPKTVARLQDHITVGGAPAARRTAAPADASGSGAASAQAPAGGQRRSSRDSKKSLAAGQTININTASVAQLTQLPGVGPATAQKIVEHREVHGPFARIEDIMKVKGIGKAKFEKMKAALSVE